MNPKPNTQMLKKIAAFAVMVTVAASCVSKKKYVELEERYNNLDQNHSTLQANYEALGAEKDSLNAYFGQKVSNLQQEVKRLENILDTKALELDEKDKVLQARAEKLRELQEIVENQRRIAENLRQRVADALVGFSADEAITVTIDNGRVKLSLSEKLLFESGRTEIDPKGKEALGKLAEVLIKNPDISIQIVGYTDSIPIRTVRFADNWDLSVIRATSIARILKEDYNVPGDRLMAAGQGEYNPVASNATKEERALNRRTEIFLIPKLDELFGIIEAQP